MSLKALPRTTFLHFDKLVRESLSVSEREQVDALTQKIDAIRKQLAGIQRPANTVEPVRQAWRDYAQSIFNLKEFIFIGDMLTLQPT